MPSLLFVSEELRLSDQNYRRRFSGQLQKLFNAEEEEEETEIRITAGVLKQDPNTKRKKWKKEEKKV